ncbi:hypothetical protein K432DRAFT_429753 [Lepidopterella palustris CBS 459.81]|uniref:Uncharacterized protein n=1 Tax=Lepidopterella palustris CBS 459.81 TaxID=1314670 RepID=A0A8E2JA35_9PEZI|nr:hypothetical protein K432DRAFT_429753 [Lepidopterella palustris CBS 459.81]
MMLMNVLFFLTLANSLVIRNTPAVITTETNTNPACILKGNSDLYGLGIRLGIYFQWISSSLANNFLHDPDEVLGALDANGIFVLALFCALVKTTISSSLDSLEAIILLRICFGYYCTVLSLGGNRVRIDEWKGKRNVPVSFLGFVARLGLLIGLVVYNIWFWFQGLEALSTQSECVRYVFIWCRGSIPGHALGFYRGLACIEVIWMFVVLMNTFIGPGYKELRNIASTRLRITRGKKRRPRLAPIFSWTSFNLPLKELKDIVGLKDSTSKESIEYDYSYAGFDVTTWLDPVKRSNGYYSELTAWCTIMAIYILWTIIGVELTLYWNGVSGVYELNSTGQFIPFVTGVVGLVRMLHLLLLDRTKKLTKFQAWAKEYLETVPSEGRVPVPPRAPVPPSISMGQMAHRIRAAASQQHKPASQNCETEPLSRE